MTFTVGQKPRLAIIGGGSSGLITLKYAVDMLPDHEIVCFERTGDITGCWGRPPRGFVSTSSKYATQFACFQKYDAQVCRSQSNRYADFFQGDEYGDYLEAFAEEFCLHERIVRNCTVTSVERTREGTWRLSVLRNNQASTETFDWLVICTGLADEPKALPACPISTLRNLSEVSGIRNQRVVVIGGGESAVDVAQRLCEPEHGNDVYLSLRSGIRVSPRYHPIRGVPSDFLRTRLLLANHPDVRNVIGQAFVNFRIASADTLRRWFPSRLSAIDARLEQQSYEVRKHWDQRLTRAAKDRLFNVYHNKSDDFLDAVAEGRLKIIGPNTDNTFRHFLRFQQDEPVDVAPDLIVPSIGYRSTFPELFDESANITLSQFFLGCLHSEYDNLAAVGFTRPIIGNIPSISEMQARYVCGVVAGQFPRPVDIAMEHQSDQQRLVAQFPGLDTQRVYPVEMFPYCDRLARRMECFPSIKKVGSIAGWWRMMRSPATTMHYFSDKLVETTNASTPIHTPWLITVLLILAKPIDWLYRGWVRVAIKDRKI